LLGFGSLAVHGDRLVINTGTGSRNETSTAASLNFVFDALIIESLFVTEILKRIVSGNSMAEIIEKIIAALPYSVSSSRMTGLRAGSVTAVTATDRLCLVTVGPTDHIPSESTAIGDCARRWLSICEVFSTGLGRTNRLHGPRNLNAGDGQYSVPVFF